MGGPLPGRVQTEVKSQKGCMHTFEMCSWCDSALKRKDTVTQATTGEDLKDMRLSGIKQTRKCTSCAVPSLPRGSLQESGLETENGDGGLEGEGGGEFVLSGDGVSDFQDEESQGGQ